MHTVPTNSLPECLQAFDEFIKGSVGNHYALAKEIGGLVAKQVWRSFRKIVKNLLTRTINGIGVFSSGRLPGTATLDSCHYSNNGPKDNSFG